MSANDIKVIPHQWIEEIWNRGNISLIDELCSEDYIHYEMHTEIPVEEDIMYEKKWIADLRWGLPDLHLSVQDLIAEIERIAIRFTARGTHKRKLLDVPPTKRTIIWHGVMILSVKKSKIHRLWIFPDRQTFVSRLRCEEK